MDASLSAIFIILILLISGYLFGKFLPKKVINIGLKSLSFIVLLLLFLMGMEFGEVFTDKSAGYDIVKNAAIFSMLIFMCTALLLFQKSTKISEKIVNGNFWQPIWGCIKAISCFILGVVAYASGLISAETSPISSSAILYLLIFLVGMDLVHFKLVGLNSKMWMLPCLTLVGSILASLLFSSMSNYSVQESLVLASGFGWFSLSGPMINQLVSPEMGSMAFMVDFFREMLSIVFLYFLGRKQPIGAIGISGAAAMDSALPFIKENCESEYIQYAIVSGFVLTLLAPVFISFTVALLP